MNNMLFQIPAEISGVKTMAHNSIRIQIDSQENLSPESISKLFSLTDKIGWFTFSVQQVKPEDLLNLPEIICDKNEKTPAQRLRSRLFVYWKEKNPKADEQNFRVWYETVLEKLGQSYLDKLN